MTIGELTFLCLYVDYYGFWRLKFARAGKESERPIIDENGFVVKRERQPTGAEILGIVRELVRRPLTKAEETELQEIKVG